MDSEHGYVTRGKLRKSKNYDRAETIAFWLACELDLDEKDAGMYEAVSNILFDLVSDSLAEGFLIGHRAAGENIRDYARPVKEFLPDCQRGGACEFCAVR